MYTPSSQEQHRLKLISLLILASISLIYLLSGVNFWFTKEVPPLPSMMSKTTHCDTTFGKVLGYAHDVPAFSNCHTSWKSEMRASVPFDSPLDVQKHPPPLNGKSYRMTGSCWDSGEYVCRFYFHHRGMFVVHTHDDFSPIWGSASFGVTRKRNYLSVQLSNEAEVTTKKGRKRHAPKFADVVVWHASRPRFPIGHMAVVVDVQDDVEAAGGAEQLQELREKRLQPLLVYIAEQNFDNTDWGGRNYSRILRFKWKDGKEAYMEDSSGFFIAGWMRPGKEIGKRGITPRDDL